MSAARRTPRDERRRRLGQNFLRADVGERVVAETGVSAGELVVDVGAGRGALSLALARRGAEVTAVEVDPAWARRLRDEARLFGDRLRVVGADFLDWRLPARPFRVVGCLPYGETTAIMRRLLDDPTVALTRADLIIQWEVARKRAQAPPSTLLSTTWAPWWEFRLGRRLPATLFRPVPAVDGGVLTVLRRDPPILPTVAAPAYARFLRAEWPFAADPPRHRRAR
ncbi:MAG TPA: rRNA adenine N(6)-methyltransferase family protein [Acidimicrobiales bacterium]|nr:rRNA adenine N(6)-methyltransferase family protein [Acidimicrobiales bacterium]